jgi:hypothetical protein
MKNLSEFLIEKINEDKIAELEKRVEKAEDKADKAEEKAKSAEKEANKSDETIKDEKSFRAAAEAKFKEVFGDDLDEDKMNETIDGLLEDNKDLVDKGEWGELIGMLNKSFAS